MKTYSAEEFKKLYGNVSFPEPTPTPGIVNDVSNAFRGGIDYAKQGYEQAQTAKTPLGKTEAGLKELAGGVGAVLSPLAPVTKYIGQGINYAADKISDIPAVQNFAGTKAGQTTARVAEDVQNTSALLSLKGGPKLAGKTSGVVSDVTKVAAKGVGDLTGGAGKYAAGVVKDLTPTTQGFINHQIAQALELTPGDLSNISKSTGNDVGRWMADHNLIGENAKSTQKLVDDFKNTNFNAVRDEIGKVQTTYKQFQVPRYVDALKQIVSKIEKVPGLEQEWANAMNLLAKDDLTLMDVQMVKELIDDHFKIYKVTGEVGDTIAKEGVANIRKELKNFIEDEVESNTGADIRQLNNDVATAKSLSDAITTRAPKGLTKSNFRAGDLATLGYGSFAGGPLVGLAALFVKKTLETPTVMLRIAKIVDQMSDAQKAKTRAQLGRGEIPEEFTSVIKIKVNGQPYSLNRLSDLPK